MVHRSIAAIVKKATSRIGECFEALQQQAVFIFLGTAITALIGSVCNARVHMPEFVSRKIIRSLWRTLIKPENYEEHPMRSRFSVKWVLWQRHLPSSKYPNLDSQRRTGTKLLSGLSSVDLASAIDWPLVKFIFSFGNSDECQITQHKNHRYLFIDEAVLNQKSNLNSLVTKVRDVRLMLNKIQQTRNQQRSEIDHTERQVIDDIKLFGLSIIAEVSRTCKLLIHDTTSLCNQARSQFSEK